MDVTRKILLSLFSLAVGFVVILVAAFSFGLGQTLQNTVMLVAGALSLVWLYFTWRGRLIVTLVGVMLTLIVGVILVPLLSR